MASFDDTVKQPMDRPSRPEALRARLSVVYPPSLRGSIAVGGELVVGRRPPEAGLKLDHPTVSRRHVTLRFDSGAGAHVVVELGSQNGSRLDGSRLDPGEPRPLGDGAVLRTGDVLLVYERGPDLDAADAPEVSREAVPGASAAATKLRRHILAAARDPSPVLLIGETGTGKEYVAREIHRLSGRAGPLLAVNCAALSRELIESQLFGHKKGAFTGAHSSEEGLLRAAAGGTLFLDEIGELPLDLQPKLLRAIQEREVLPVGETRPIPIDVRLVSATLRDLTELIGPGQFRRDLYARLSPWEIRVPSLAGRRADLLAWLERLYRRWHHERDPAKAPPALELEPSAAERILLAAWPDNLRGLERRIHRAAADPAAWLELPEPAPGPVQAPERVSAPAGPRRSRPSKAELERVLAQHDGSVRAAAKHFGRERRQIYRWLEQYGLRGR